MGKRFDGLWNKEWQEPKLGDAHGTPRYSRITKILSLGMPRKVSPLSSSFIGNFTWSNIFICRMICVLLGASIYFVIICLMLFMYLVDVASVSQRCFPPFYYYITWDVCEDCLTCDICLQCDYVSKSCLNTWEL